jgi:hypothetical protein
MIKILPALLLPLFLLNFFSSMAPIFFYNPEKEETISEESAINEVDIPINIPVVWRDTFDGNFIFSSSLFYEGWADLPQVKFWRNVFMLPPDQGIINVSSCRTQLGVVELNNWMKLSDVEKKAERDRIKTENNLDTAIRIFVTSGKNHFYRFTDAAPHIPAAIKVFQDMQVDPWYAQTILLIESPGNNYARSVNGAVGPFQLMRANAIRAGLKVTKTVDERSDLQRSAYGAAKLLNDVCLPSARRMMLNHTLEYKETDLWFRLLVLHIYHAGASNVSGVLNVIQPETGGMELIQKMWQTEYRGFKNQSQNYSQIALAALVQKQMILQQVSLQE